MRCLLFLMLVIFIASCNQNAFSNLSTDEKLANKAIKKAALRIQKKTGMIPSGEGGRMMNEIKMLALSFDYYQSISIDEGRELLITAMNEFLDVVNTDEKIRPYLNNYPFEPKNIEVMIFLRNPDGSNITLGKLSVISIIDAILEYDMNDPKTTFLKTFYKETYEEALQKIGGNSKKAA